MPEVFKLQSEVILQLVGSLRVVNPVCNFALMLAILAHTQQI
jgi:hypothetical protein